MRIKMIEKIVFLFFMAVEENVDWSRASHELSGVFELEPWSAKPRLADLLNLSLPYRRDVSAIKSDKSDTTRGTKVTHDCNFCTLYIIASASSDSICLTIASATASGVSACMPGRPADDEYF